MNDESKTMRDVLASDVDPLVHAPIESLRRAQEERLLTTWQTPRGWRYWSSVNNSDVGLWYTAMAFVFFLFAGVLALLMRIQLAVPNNTFLSADFYNQAFTVHGSVMMFLFALPIFEAIAILLLPQMLGARDLPFPRLSAFGFWCFLLGGGLSLWFDLLQCGAKWWLVHVSSADLHLSTGYWRRYLALGVLVYRGGCNRRRS